MKKAQFIIGGVMLLYLVGFYIALGIAIDVEASNLISLWPLWVSLIVEAVAICVGFWRMPKQHRTPAIAAVAITTLLLQQAIGRRPFWYVPIVAAAVVIIMCIAVFWPVKNNATTD